MSRKFEIMKALIAAWTAGDIDAALGFMTDDIVWHYAAAVAPPLKGKEKARKFLDRFKADITEVRWRLFDYAERGDRLERRDGVWRIAARRLAWEWNHEMPMAETWGRGLLAPDPTVLVRGAKAPNDIVYTS